MTPLAIWQSSNNEAEAATSYKCRVDLGFPDPEKQLLKQVMVVEHRFHHKW
jgi:hypothetical protein